jgi:broad specificity phosphatase PhoE
MRVNEKIYLIRHGKPASVWGEEDPDPGLDETGRAQARGVAEALMALSPEERPRFVVSSPLRRCRETAQPLADALGVTVEIDPAVGEIPTPAGLSLEDRPAWLREAMAGDWAGIVGDIDYEAWRRDVARALMNRAGGAVFSHFIAINGVMSLIQGKDAVIVFRPDHVSCSALAINGGELGLVRLGAEAVTRVN